MRGSVQPTPLIALLSQALVAFTIEADNVFEERMPHRTAADRGNPAATGPWLTSLTYWANYLRRMPDEGITARDLARGAGDDAASIKSRLDELRRWRYVTLKPDGTDVGATIVIPTENGRRARDTWAPIDELVTGRWRERFSAATDDLLRLVAGAPADLPAGFPITAWSRTTRTRTIPAPSTSGASTIGAPTTGLPATGLYSGLARTVLALAREFDAGEGLSLAVTLDFARIVPTDGAPVRELPLLAGVSKEAIAIQVGRLESAGHGAVVRDSAGTKRFALTSDGIEERDAARARLDAHEARWAATSGPLRDALTGIVGDRMSGGLHPPTTGWRATGPYRAQTAAIVADPAAALPWFPMVSHRGGYPDGF